MHNAFRGGTPDVWYSGPGGDLWVEYKWIAKIPKSGIIVPNLSALQLDWLTKRRLEGRNVLVVVGTPKGALSLHLEVSWSSYKYGGERLHTDAELAGVIARRCT